MNRMAFLDNSKIRQIKKDKGLYILVLLPIIYYLVFWYYPMAGLQIAFKNYKFSTGIWGSPWADSFGMGNFLKLFANSDFLEIVLNTVSVNVLTLIFSFPIPIILAILLNECRLPRYKSLVQSFSFLPHFISTAAVISIITVMLSPESGIVNNIMSTLGFERIYFRMRPEWFRPLYIMTNIWQEAGFSAIIYLAALSGINQEIYEVAEIDGASRLSRIWYISIPSILPTIIILLIMAVGKIMNIAFERVLLLQTPTNLDVSETLQTFIYKTGIINGRFSYSAAAQFFDRGIGLILTLFANSISKKLSKISLW